MRTISTEKVNQERFLKSLETLLIKDRHIVILDNDGWYLTNEGEKEAEKIYKVYFPTSKYPENSGLDEFNIEEVKNERIN